MIRDLRLAYASLGGFVTTRVLKETMQDQVIAGEGELETLRLRLAYQDEQVKYLNEKISFGSSHLEQLERKVSQSQETILI